MLHTFSHTLSSREVTSDSCNLHACCVQCGCACVSCKFEGPVSGTTANSTDPAVCQSNEDRNGFSCLSEDKSQCAAEFSTTDQLPFCAIEQPSRFAPLYDLSGGLNDTSWAIDDDEADGGGGRGGPAGGNIPPGAASAEPILTTTEFMHTGESALGDAAMGRLVRQPDFTPLAANLAAQADAQVCSVRLTTLALVSCSHTTVPPALLHGGDR